MGNFDNGCCTNQQLSQIENVHEKEIEDIIVSISMTLKNKNQIEALSRQIFKTDLLNMDSNPLEWITNVQYYQFLNSIFAGSDNINIAGNQHKRLMLLYNKSHVSSNVYRNEFNLLLLIWLIYVSNNRTYKENIKIEMIKEIIVKKSKVITFATFSEFILTVLEIVLLDITENYCNSVIRENSEAESINENMIGRQKKIIQFGYDNEELNYLKTKIFNEFNVCEYHKWICNKMKSILTCNKNNLRNDNIINNEFINDSKLNKFFQENMFMLNAFDLRINFYEKYSLPRFD